MKVTLSTGIRDTLITIAIVAVAIVVSIIVMPLSVSDLPIHLIFVLAVLIVSRFTDGFIFGVIASGVAVLVINFAFTYPFFELNFTILGYPFTFITLFLVSIITSMLTTQIKQQQKIHAEAEREKLYANFLRAISHDLRTPLTTIVGSTSAILDDDLSLTDDQKRLLLTEIRNDAAWLIRMVENVLSITRVRGETKILKPLEPLEELVGEIVATFRKRYPDTPLNVSIPPDLLFIPMDATLIGQVIMNLLENAVLHGKGMTYVTLKITIESEEAVFAVINDGDETDITAIQRLVDGNGLTPEKHGNTDSRRDLGIGLSVCASIVTAHGGKMRIRSNAGGGVCAEFVLPLREGESNDT